MVFKNLLSKNRTVDIKSCFPDGIVLIKDDGIIQWVNDITTNILNNISVDTNIDDYLENGLAAIDLAVTSGEPSIAKIKDVEEYVEITSKKNENIYIVSMRDTTQKYKTVNNIIEGHENTKKINNDKNAFLLKLSNELKAPLHSIIGFSQAIIDGLGGKINKKQDKYLRIINKNSSDLLYFFNMLMELSETEADLFDKEMRMFDIINATNAIVRTNSQLYTEKQVNITVNVEENTVKTIYSDEKAFKTMFNILLETLIRSMDIGDITIEVSNADENILAERDIKNPKALLFTLTDSNNSILESEFETLFEPYAIINQSNKRTILRAISLACVKNLIKYLNGTIWIETAALKGTSFKIILPFEKDLNE